MELKCGVGFASSSGACNGKQYWDHDGVEASAAEREGEKGVLWKDNLLVGATSPGDRCGDRRDLIAQRSKGADQDIYR